MTCVPVAIHILLTHKQASRQRLSLTHLPSRATNTVIRLSLLDCSSATWALKL